MLKKLTAVLLTAGAFFAANAAPKVTISGKEQMLLSTQFRRQSIL